MKKNVIIACLVFIAGGLFGYGLSFLFSRYKAQTEMFIPITELSTFEYPDDPTPLSVFYESYGNRFLRLVEKEGSLFDFHFESANPNVASITLSDIDLSLYVPIIPDWIKGDTALEKIALVEREWNQQQVQFHPGSPKLEIAGGDGFEKSHIVSVELIRNCLNAGLWEIQLFTHEQGQKVLYYHGWFTFPLGHYKNVFEKNNHLSYWRHWHCLEHWVSPAKKKVDLAKLRSVISESIVLQANSTEERIIAKGEQINKLRTLSAKSILSWKDFPEKRKNVAFASFTPPGCYHIERKWGNEYERIASLQQIVFRHIQSPASQKKLAEIECCYNNPETQEECRFLIGGFDVDTLPLLSLENYNHGFEMPMGISLPPVFQTYGELELAPPAKSPFFCVLLDDKDQWIDHHKVAIDGAILHKDINNPQLLHLYLLSYQRHTLIAHYEFSIPPEDLL